MKATNRNNLGYLVNGWDSNRSSPKHQHSDVSLKLDINCTDISINRQRMNFNKTSATAITLRYIDHLTKDVTEILIHPSDVNKNKEFILI
jgi:hypothetical protein